MRCVSALESGNERVQPQPAFGCKLNPVAYLESPPLVLPRVCGCRGNSTGLQTFMSSEAQIQLLQPNRFRIQQLGTLQRGPSSLDQPLIGSPVPNVPPTFPAEAAMSRGTQADERRAPPVR